MTDHPATLPTPPRSAPKAGAGKLIVSITLFLAVGGGLVALYFGRELVEARRARMAPTNPVPGAGTTPAR